MNPEARSIIANHRNASSGRPIAFSRAGRRIETGATKFGARVGDGAMVGANAVIAPGATLERGAVVPRLGLVDQSC